MARREVRPRRDPAGNPRPSGRSRKGRDELRTRTAGELAGFWMANPAVGRGEDLIAAGLMLISGPVDGDQLVEAVPAGFERGMGSLQGYDPSG